MKNPLLILAFCALVPLAACATMSGDAALKAGDLDLAVQQYQEAAAGGDGAAALKLGQLYATYAVETGEDPSAVHWLEKSCSLGTMAGCHAAGMAYEKGEGTFRDPNRALEFFSIAARRGYMPSQYQVGTLHATGQVRSANPVDGYKWLLIARDRANAGFEEEAFRNAVIADTDGYLARLESQLTPDQRRRALAEKRAWRPED